jgi:hypothetical protein
MAVFDDKHDREAASEASETSRSTRIILQEFAGGRALSQESLAGPLVPIV